MGLLSGYWFASASLCTIHLLRLQEAVSAPREGQGRKRGTGHGITTTAPAKPRWRLHPSAPHALIPRCAVDDIAVKQPGCAALVSHDCVAPSGYSLPRRATRCPGEACQRHSRGALSRSAVAARASARSCGACCGRRKPARPREPRCPNLSPTVVSLAPLNRKPVTPAVLRHCAAMPRTADRRPPRCAVVLDTSWPEWVKSRTRLSCLTHTDPRATTYRR